MILYMKFMDRIRKWLFKEENVGIINIGDLIAIPGRDYYKSDIEKLNKIDSYKEEYLRVLSSKKRVAYEFRIN